MKVLILERPNMNLELSRKEYISGSRSTVKERTFTSLKLVEFFTRLLKNIENISIVINILYWRWHSKKILKVLK